MVTISALYTKAGIAIATINSLRERRHISVTPGFRLSAEVDLKLQIGASAPGELPAVTVGPAPNEIRKARQKCSAFNLTGSYTDKKAVRGFEAIATIVALVFENFATIGKSYSLSLLQDGFMLFEGHRVTGEEITIRSATIPRLPTKGEEEREEHYAWLNVTRKLHYDARPLWWGEVEEAFSAWESKGLENGVLKIRYHKRDHIPDIGFCTSVPGDDGGVRLVWSGLKDHSLPLREESDLLAMRILGVGDQISGVSREDFARDYRIRFLGDAEINIFRLRAPKGMHPLTLTSSKFSWHLDEVTDERVGDLVEQFTTDWVFTA